MILACRNAGVVLSVIQTVRFRGTVARAHKLVQEGRIGDVRMIDLRTLFEWVPITGQSWSQRVDATRATGGRRASVRVDGEVVGTERVTVPAGTYDTIKVKRRIYAGDFDGSRSETNITETEWYAPALGRAVRAEVNSNFMDQSLCGDEMSACRPRRGDWHIFELLDAGSAKK
jgi:hypothetical protein